MELRNLFELIWIFLNSKNTQLTYFLDYFGGFQITYKIRWGGCEII